MNTLLNASLSIIVAFLVGSTPITSERPGGPVGVGQTQQENLILSKDYGVARDSLQKAVAKKDKATIRLGLERNSLSFKNEVIRAIETLDDKSFVPDVIKVLEENQSITSGGTETAVEQALLSRNAIATLGKLTGLKLDLRALPDENSVEKFNPSNYVSAEEVETALRQVRVWMRANRENIST